MSKLSDKYNSSEREKYWQEYWRKHQTYKWKNDKEKSETFVIDTPPPTVSGVLHMGHVFSYCQADFVARFQRMLGKDVFYPMGFDDNGLPTERLVEKVIGKKAGIYESENGHGSFVKKCREVVDEAELEFEALFNSIALSVDWEQKYQTISPQSQKISQASFLDLYNKGLVEKKFEPVFWDISDRTALAQADLIDKEVEGVMNEIEFSIDGSDEKIIIMTTRPELLPACVAVMVHPEDSRYKHLHKKNAVTPIFGVKVKIIPDDLVQLDKGTGAVMCCTFGDETDIRWWKKHNLELKVIIGKDGKINFDHELVSGKTIKQAKESIIEALKNTRSNYSPLEGESASVSESAGGQDVKDLNSFYPSPNQSASQSSSTLPQGEGYQGFALQANAGPQGEGYQGFALQANAGPQGEGYQGFALQANAGPQGEGDRRSLLISQTPIKRPVKCAERSGVPIEILVVPQWFIKILDKKELLKEKAAQCNWHPEYMKVRIDQWIDGLQWDWCISRQRFFGVSFPVWYSCRKGEVGKVLVADIDQLPCDPAIDLPKGYSREEVTAETDIMDTWATSSVSPQLSSRGISNETDLGENERHDKLFPADLRPQAHEIIRTWAFYTLVKSTLHQNSIPWKNLMISGWCLASDKTKMSKSKGNVVTPTSLIEEKGSDIVRYWASTSHLGADTAYSEDVFKIGQKLITKLFNASKFASMNFELLQKDAEITEASDLWILSRLQQTVSKATEEFNQFEYARAREAIEQFFWHDFCDNYLEICKVRSYGLNAQKLEGIEFDDEQKKQIIKKQQSAILTLKTCLSTLLKIFAPFVPHICDEIYSNLFVDEFSKKGSINSRGNWPKSSEILFSQKHLEIGEAALAVIFEVRKFKSEKNISMKTTVKNIRINLPHLMLTSTQSIEADKNFINGRVISSKMASGFTEADFLLIEDDLKNVCNAQELEIFGSGSVENLVEVIL